MRVRHRRYSTPSGFTVCCDCDTPGTLHCVCEPGLLICNLFEVETVCCDCDTHQLVDIYGALKIQQNLI